MNARIVESPRGITVVAGGPVTAREARLAVARAPVVVAADGGADRALSLGLRPVAAIGDLDSLSQAGRAALGSAVHLVAEQETTDFDKVLRSIAAPFVLALGVLGGRLDHGLAALAGLVAAPGPVLALGGPDVVFAAPPQVRLRLRAGDRLSLFPLGRVTGASRGLDWPIEGLDFAPDGRIGTSNRVSAGPVELRFDAPGMLVILPRARLDAALDAVAPGWRGVAPRSFRGG
jgi:thiamine pyrophosphokinase